MSHKTVGKDDIIGFFFYKKERQTHRRLKDTLIAPIPLSRLPHLVLGRVGVHNPVLACNLLTVALFIRLLLLDIPMQLLLKVAIERLPLPLLEPCAALIGRGALDVAFQRADLVADGRVFQLGRGDQAVELALGGCLVAVDITECKLVQLADALYVGRERADLVAHV